MGTGWKKGPELQHLFLGLWAPTFSPALFDNQITCSQALTGSLRGGALHPEGLEDQEE